MGKALLYSWYAVGGIASLVLYIVLVVAAFKEGSGQGLLWMFVLGPIVCGLLEFLVVIVGSIADTIATAVVKARADE